MLRTWSTTTSVPASAWANRPSRSCSVLATGLLLSTSPRRVTWHAQWENFPTSSPMTAAQVAASVSMVVSFQSSVDRSAASRDTHITWPWRPWRSLVGGARQFPISRQKQRRPRRQHPPGPRGAGAKGRPRAPDRQSLGTYANRSSTVQADGSNGRPTTLQNCNGRRDGIEGERLVWLASLRAARRHRCSCDCWRQTA